MSVVLRTEQLSKQYRLGVINRRMLYQEIQSRWARWRGKEDPHTLIGHPVRTEKDGTFWALRDVSFDVQEGDVVGILGRNGAGKSTLLKILSQITSPTEGRVLIKGRVASLLEVGTGFHPELTGRDNVFLNGAILGMTRRDIAGKFDEIAAFSGIEQFLDTPVKRYSSGMTVRLAFAVAAHLEPEILIIDEVLAVGDASFQQKCLGKMSEVAKGGRTILFVSHNAAAVESLCTRGIVLDDGKLVFAGTQTEAVAQYAQLQKPRTASLAGRADRKGSGQIRVNAVELREAGGAVIASARSGQDIEVWLHYETQVPGELDDLTARITVVSELGVPIFTQLNALKHQPLAPLPPRGSIVCRLPRLPLPPSLYRINYSLNLGRRGGLRLDALTDAADLPVEAGHFFGTSDCPSVQAGLCLADGDWRVEPAAER